VREKSKVVDVIVWRNTIGDEEKCAEEDEQGREEGRRRKSRGQRKTLALILLHIFILFLLFLKGPSSPPPLTFCIFNTKGYIVE
jgi:hypothetical protein